MRLLILILLFPLVSFGQTKLSQLERASTRWDLPVAYRNVNGTYAQGYLGFLEYLDSINYNAGVVNVVIPGYGIEGFITNDTLVLYADTTELQRKLTLTTSGTSGAATLSGGTLNIPQYTAGISGTGTQYKVPRWLTSSSLENSATPLWDYNGIVGIGQTGTGDFITNAYKFQVYQPSGALTTYHKATGTNNVFERYENPNAAWWHGIHTTNNWGVFGGGINFFNILYSGQVSISNLSGTGTRMVVASPSGVLSTQTIPAASTTSLFNTSITGGVKVNTTTQTNSGININSGTGISVAFTDAANMTITNTAPATATNLTFSGVASPFTLNSSTGTDVTFTAGSNITLTGTSTNLTIASTGGGSLPSGTQNQTLRHNGTTYVSNDALRVFGVGLESEYVQTGSFTLPFQVTSGPGSTGTRLAVNGGIQLVPQAITSTGLSGLSSSNNITRITVGSGLSLTNNTLSANTNSNLYAQLAISSTTRTPTVDSRWEFTTGNTGPTGSPSFNTSNYNFTINTSGVYEITFTGNAKSANTGVENNIHIRVNEISPGNQATKRTIGTTQYHTVATHLVQSLTAGDRVDVWIDIAGGSITYNSGFLLIKKIN